MPDVIVVGAGPAGSIAAIVLARAGADVLMLDRARFPRDKLCGDSLNPGAVALLVRLGLRGALDHGVEARGMTVTGESRSRIDAPYPAGVSGSFLRRKHFDNWLVNRAIDEGVRFEDGVRAVGPAFSTDLDEAVCGIRVRRRDGRITTLNSTVTIAADGRRSTMAAALGLSRRRGSFRSMVAPPIRRWAVGGYFEDVHGLSNFGEMHIRKGRYFGIAPLSDGTANVCLVTPDLKALAAYRDPTRLLLDAVRSDGALGPRLQSAKLVDRPSVLGPLSAPSVTSGARGLLVAGDAAGFVDPMTGDGLYFAMRGGELAANAALGALAGTIENPNDWLRRRRSEEFAMKESFNRALARVVASPACVHAASLVARLIPSAVARMVSFAGDVGRRTS